MSAILRRCLSTAAYDQWAALHNQFPSATDAKIGDLATTKIESTLTLQSAKDREIYLIAQMHELKAIPSLYDTTVKEIVAQLKEVRQFIAANKQ